MDLTIEFYLDGPQRKALRQVFSESQDPGFTIMEESAESEGGIAAVSVYFKNSVILWYLIPNVERKISFSDRCDAFMKQIKADPESLFNKNDELNGLI